MRDKADSAKVFTAFDAKTCTAYDRHAALWTKSHYFLISSDDIVLRLWQIIHPRHSLDAAGADDPLDKYLRST